jgi:hypothetical protein
MGHRRSSILGGFTEDHPEALKSEPVHETIPVALPRVQKKRDRNELMTVGIPQNVKEALEKHFAHRGLRLMTGCRMVLTDYARKEGLL